MPSENISLHQQLGMYSKGDVEECIDNMHEMRVALVQDIKDYPDRWSAEDFAPRAIMQSRLLERILLEIKDNNWKLYKVEHIDAINDAFDLFNEYNDD